MPNPKKFKDKKSFMKACVPIVINEGTAKDGKQGYAICLSMWKNRNKKAKSGLNGTTEPVEITEDDIRNYCRGILLDRVIRKL